MQIGKLMSFGEVARQLARLGERMKEAREEIWQAGEEPIQTRSELERLRDLHGQFVRAAKSAARKSKTAWFWNKRHHMKRAYVWLAAAERVGRMIDSVMEEQDAA